MASPNVVRTHTESSEAAGSSSVPSGASVNAQLSWMAAAEEEVRSREETRSLHLRRRCA